MKILNYEQSFDKDELYFCYSPNLYIFLTKIKDVHPISKNKNSKTNKWYSVFLKTDKLQECLAEWTDNKNRGEYALKGGMKWKAY